MEHQAYRHEPKSSVGSCDDADLSKLVEELALDGIQLTKEEARRAIENLADLLLLISTPLPLPPAPEGHAEEAETS